MHTDQGNSLSWSFLWRHWYHHRNLILLTSYHPTSHGPHLQTLFTYDRELSSLWVLEGINSQTIIHAYSIPDSCVPDRCQMNSTTLIWWQLKLAPDIAKCPLRIKLPQWRTTGLGEREWEVMLDVVVWADISAWRSANIVPSLGHMWKFTQKNHELELFFKKKNH